MKYTLRIPTAEQYAYIEAECEGTPQDALAQYQEITQLVRYGEGLPSKEWNAALDELLETHQLRDGVELWERMNQMQQAMLQEVKKSLKRRGINSNK